MIRTLVILAIITAAASCGKKCTCEFETIPPAFVGYNNSEIDTIIIKRFEKGSNFSRQVDSFTLTVSNTVYSRTGTDTTLVYPQNTSQRLSEDSDWQLTNPFDNRTIRVSDIVVEKRVSHCGGIFSMDKQYCISPVASFNRDGVLTKLDMTSPFHAIIIKK
ncbi:MAG TPA: hypothetical protein VEB42_04000 [Chitinophagaceae bacterium]|nr:hypothetical protein [Chitinophagaceae bacterium]